VKVFLQKKMHMVIAIVNKAMYALPQNDRRALHTELDYEMHTGKKKVCHSSFFYWYKEEKHLF
jgi:hypothetical protein